MLSSPLPLSDCSLSVTQQMECFRINLIYFACPSGRKKPIENVFGKGSLYLSHSAWANQVSSLPVLQVGNIQRGNAPQF